MSTRFYMVRTRVCVPALVRYARELGAPVHPGIGVFDLGYLVHSALRRVYGPIAPQPFAVVEDGGARDVLTVLGYASEPSEALAAQGKRSGWSGAAEVFTALPESKAMPEQWPVDAEYRYRVRICPVARMHTDGAHHRAGAEVDVFVRACWQAGDRVVDRATVYADWFAKVLRQNGAEPLETATLEQFRLTRLVRRTQHPERKAKTIQRPDATLRGRLRVCDPQRFSRAVRNGLGRHRAFGFGMLLLRRSIPHTP